MCTRSYAYEGGGIACRRILSYLIPATGSKSSGRRNRCPLAAEIQEQTVVLSPLLYPMLRIIFLTASVLSTAFAAELQVNVYEGPKECLDEEKAKAGQSLQMHYTGTIDQTSATGEKSKN